jgi:excisionase family DNA binding protein
MLDGAHRMTIITDKLYFTTLELSKIFAVTPWTIRNWRSKGLRETRVGGAIRFHREDVNEFITASQRGA